MAHKTVSLLFCALIVLQAAFAVAALSERQSVSSVSVEGLVFCDQCLEQKMTQNSNVLKGAKVAITCEGMRNEGEKASMVAVTNGKGAFKAYLSDKLFDNDGNIKCSATLRSSPHVSCRLPSKTAGISSTAFSRSSAAHNSHITYRVSDLSFRPAAASPLCAQAFYYEPSPYEKPPMEKPPMEKPPMEKPPKEEPPMEKPPMEKPPKEEPPKEQPPKEEPPVFEPPIYKPPAEKPPMEKPPMEKPPVEKPPMEKPPMEEPPMEKPPMEKPPYEEPKFEFPKFKFPKFSFPKYKFPKLDFPKFKFPKFDFPKYKYPKYPPTEP